MILLRIILFIAFGALIVVTLSKLGVAVYTKWRELMVSTDKKLKAANEIVIESEGESSDSSETSKSV